MALIRIETQDADGRIWGRCYSRNGNQFEFDCRCLFVTEPTLRLVLAVPRGGRLEIGAAE
jgi:hypothetical protein